MSDFQENYHMEGRTDPDSQDTSGHGQGTRKSK